MNAARTAAPPDRAETCTSVVMNSARARRGARGARDALRDERARLGAVRRDDLRDALDGAPQAPEVRRA